MAPVPSRVARRDGRARTGAIGLAFPSVLAAAQAGAPWACESLYRLLSPAVLGYLRLQGAAEPEDLTSEVFLGVFRSLGSFRGGEEGFRSWVFTIAHRRLVDEHRRAGRRPCRADDDAELEAYGGDAEDDALARLAEARVRQVCDSLMPDQRDVLLLRVVGGLTIDEVATALGRTPGAVKSLQHRGLVALRARLSPSLATL